MEEKKEVKEKKEEKDEKKREKKKKTFKSNTTIKLSVSEIGFTVDSGGMLSLFPFFFSL